MSSQIGNHSDDAAPSIMPQDVALEAPMLVFTENAAQKVAELMWEEGNLNLNLRVFITGGGCSGFEYGLTFDEVIQPDDLVVTKEIMFTAAEDADSGTGGSATRLMTVKLVVDPISLQHLSGAEIDYKEDLEGARFIFRNPNAKTTCSCGSSFDV